jgi:hypothetical protein
MKAVTQECEHLEPEWVHRQAVRLAKLLSDTDSELLCHYRIVRVLLQAQRQALRELQPKIRRPKSPGRQNEKV